MTTLKDQKLFLPHWVRYAHEQELEEKLTHPKEKILSAQEKAIRRHSYGKNIRESMRASFKRKSKAAKNNAKKSNSSKPR